MVCGGFPAVLLICCCVFFVCIVPFMAFDYVKKLYQQREQARRKKQVLDTMFTCDRTSLSIYYGEEAAQSIECCICLAPFENGEIAVLPCDARHNFHKECITSWMEYHVACPLCKTEIK